MCIKGSFQKEENQNSTAYIGLTLKFDSCPYQFKPKYNLTISLYRIKKNENLLSPDCIQAFDYKHTII